MTYLVAFTILTRCLLIQGNLEWKVLKKITEYGQNVTLVCNVSNCCHKSAGWDKYTPQQRTIIIDVKTWRPTKKYDGNILTDGYTLVIRNLTEQDLNISYSCVYGSSLGDKQYLLEENVFDYISTTHQNSPIDNRTFSDGNISTTQQNGLIGNQTFSAGKIAGIIIGVSAAVLVVLFIICFWKRRKERHRNIRNSNSIEGSNEGVPLINPYLKEPNDIQCIEGEDAILTCKLKPNITAVKWLKNGKEITQIERCIMSTVDTQHTLTIKNTTESDSGDYYVQAGTFSQKIQLNITDPFLEEPIDIQCTEGEDAILTCKLRPNIQTLKWLKNGKEITQIERCIMSTVDTEHTLTIKNTTESDSGDYYVQVGKFSKKIQLNITGIPRELSADERHTYMHAIKSGTEVRQYVRIQVVGKDRVGKTSLVRRLLFLEKGEYGGKSTDGIDISRKCQIRNSDGDWIVGEVDSQRKIIERMQRALNKQRRTEEPVSDMSPPIPPKENNSLQNSRNMPKNQSKEKSFETNTFETNEGEETLNNEVQYTKSTHELVAALYANSDENKLYMRDTKEKPENNDVNLPQETSVSIAVPAENPNDVISEKDDHTTKMIVEKMNDIIWEAKTEKEKNTSEGLIECGIWDFAGQRDYYASHQTFFTPHAIYILVADISEDIKDINYDGNVDYNSIGNYIEFWFDSIHCLCKDLSEDELCPPIIMVCTGTDKVEKDKDWKRMYNEKVSTIISKQKRADHRRGIYFISNTHFLEEDIEEIKRLRAHISEIAKKMKYFAETVPTRWIQLENVLEVLKGVNKINVCSFKTIQQFADRMSVEEEELLLFLNYQHQIGNIIFLKEIREYIILQPEWLVKCFRCLVCDSNADKRDFNVICPTAFGKLTTTGELSDKLVDQLFQKEPDLNFIAYKTHLLNVMEKFDIVIKPTFRDTRNKACHISNSYYLPCMIEKPSPYTSIRNAFIPNNADVAITPWLVLEFEFLPLAYFNHILFHYIRHFEVCIESIDKSEHKAIYSGKAVFFLDEFRKFIICFSHNAISLQIWEWGGVNEDTHDIYEHVLNTLRNAIESIRGNLSHDISYTIKAKCSTGDYSNKAGRKSLKELPKKKIYMCEEHQQTHPNKEIEHVWLKHDDRYYKKPDQKGLVLIVNLWFNARGYPRRVFNKDIPNLSNFFKDELKYQVEFAVHSMTKTELQNYFMEIDRTYLVENSQDYHSFICVILGYENEGGIQTTDIPITIDEIYQIFKSKPGGKFNGKPKLFLIQSMFRFKYLSDQTKRHVYDSLGVSKDISEIDADSLVVLSSKRDVIRSNALIVSPFIRVFVSVAKNKYRDTHVADILSDVIRELETNPEYTNALNYFGTPKIKSALTKKCFL